MEKTQAQGHCYSQFRNGIGLSAHQKQLRGTYYSYEILTATISHNLLVNISLPVCNKTIHRAN